MKKTILGKVKICDLVPRHDWLWVPQLSQSPQGSLETLRYCLYLGLQHRCYPRVHSWSRSHGHSSWVPLAVLGLEPSVSSECTHCPTHLVTWINTKINSVFMIVSILQCFYNTCCMLPIWNDHMQMWMQQKQNTVIVKQHALSGIIMSHKVGCQHVVNTGVM